MPACTLCSRTIGWVCIDVVVQETTNDEIEIANHPIEKGAQISDHAWLKPREITIEGIKSSGGALSGYRELRQLQETLEPFDLVTGLDLFRNMLIQKLSATRDKDSSQICQFTATCREVIIVNTASTAGDGGTDRSSSTQNRGQVQARPAGGSEFDSIVSGSRAAA